MELYVVLEVAVTVDVEPTAATEQERDAQLMEAALAYIRVNGVDRSDVVGVSLI